MKRVLIYTALALAAIGCTKEETTETIPTDGVINLSAGAVSRVTTDNDCTWETEDKVGIYTDQTDEDNLLFQISDTATGELENKSDATLYTLTSGKRTYSAYYPYDENLDKDDITIAIDCTSTQSKFILWATATTNDKDVPLQFTHMLPKVTFKFLAGGLDIDYLTSAKVWLTGANTKGTFNVKTGEFEITETDKIEFTIGSDNTITAYMLPTASGNVTLWVTGADEKNNTFLRNITDSWESGGSYEYTITVGETETD